MGAMYTANGVATWPHTPIGAAYGTRTWPRNQCMHNKYYVNLIVSIRMLLLHDAHH